MKLKLKPIYLVLIAALSAQGCTTTANKGEKNTFKDTLKETFNSDDPCSNSKRNVGIALGAAGGVLLAVLTGDKNSLGRAVIGGLVGAGIGGLIGNEIGSRQCEISKIQKKYDAEIQMTALALPVVAEKSVSGNQQDSSIGKPDTKPQDVGLSVSVVDKTGQPQFENNSDEIQPQARAMFLDIAKAYAKPEARFETKVAKEKKEIEKAFKDRRVLLVGHTDDSGDSERNAELSERRAKTIAKLFEEAGVPEDRIFYQGAGETMPIDSNDTVEGRAKNRRVEILDLTNEEVFQLYLINRRPNTTFYRASAKTKEPNSQSTLEKALRDTPKESVANSTKNKKTKVVSIAKKNSKPATVVGDNQEKQNAIDTAKIIDFGGKPFTTALAMVSTGDLVVTKPSSFTLINEAQASDLQSISTCNVDRPRSAGAVKSLKNGLAYKTAEYMPGMYGRTWYDTVGNNLVVLNKVSVLREGMVPGNKPELKVYSNYRNDSNRAPEVLMNPDVNTYQTSNGLLYRVFANGNHGIQCMDILIPVSNSNAAKDGKLIYGNGAAEFVSDFKPKIKS